MRSAAGDAARQVLVTGATGFVGRRLAPLLEQLGWRVVCLTRDARRAACQWPARTWIEGDISRADDLQRALSGCQAAYYLVHSLADNAAQLVQREGTLADTFATAAERAGVERIVYLGATAPQGPPSEHLRSRLEAGRVLRAGQVPVLELRAGMIVGYGSASWQIVRDLAARFPAMVLPRWLQTRSQPVAIDDVIVALATGLRDTAERQSVVRPARSRDNDLPRSPGAHGQFARPHAHGRRGSSGAESNVVGAVDSPGNKGRLVRGA